MRKALRTQSEIDALNHLMPGTRLVAITPSDADDLSENVRGLYVGTGGDIKLQDWDGTTVTLVGIFAGTLLPIGAKRIYSTDTTASDIVGIL